MPVLAVQRILLLKTRERRTLRVDRDTTHLFRERNVRTVWHGSRI